MWELGDAATGVASHNARDAAEDIRHCLVLDPSLQPWLEQQVAMIPAVQRWQAEFLRWYREIQRDAARS